MVCGVKTNGIVVVVEFFMTVCCVERRRISVECCMTLDVSVNVSFTLLMI